jgi:hypothetical protein
MLNHILIEDNFISEQECSYIINLFKDKTEKQIINGINYYHIPEDDYKKLDFLVPKITSSFNNYSNKFKEIKNYLDGSLVLTELKFKHFKPGNFFENWHWEHSYKDPLRVVGLTIYLSDHNCGTEFLDGSTILSRKGRMTIFPSSFTHTHKGQLCPDHKDRYLFTAYFHTSPLIKNV